MRQHIEAQILFVVQPRFDLPLFIHYGRRFTKHVDHSTRNIWSGHSDGDGNQRQHDRILDYRYTFLLIPLPEHVFSLFVS
jgi:hypothetical protein